MKNYNLDIPIDKCDIDRLIEAIKKGELSDLTNVNNVPVSNSEVVFMSSNPLRKEVTVHNSSNGVIYVIRGGGVTNTNYNWKLKIGDHLTIDDFRGDIKGLFMGTNGFAMVSESYYS